MFQLIILLFGERPGKTLRVIINSVRAPEDFNSPLNIRFSAIHFIDNTLNELYFDTTLLTKRHLGDLD